MPEPDWWDKVEHVVGVDGSLWAQATDDDPNVSLAAVVELRRQFGVGPLRHIDDLEAAGYRKARAKGWTLAMIADVLGVTRQAVHKKYETSRARSPSGQEGAHSTTQRESPDHASNGELQGDEGQGPDTPRSQPWQE